MDLHRELQNIEDHLIPRLNLDVWERSVYYHLLRHTHLEGRSTDTFGIASLASALGLSDTKLRDVVRSLDANGCIKILSRSRNGHLLEIVLPSQIDGVVPSTASMVEIDLASVDFYTGRRQLAAILEREDGRCFYCLKVLSEETCVLDHVVATVQGGDNSFLNIVACCHDCNSNKGEHDVREFLRTLYRRSLLSEAEFDDRLGALEQLRRGERMPRTELYVL